jgi:hypothetical protein
MLKSLRNYAVAAIIVFIIVLLIGVYGVELAWGESAMLSAFLTVIGVGGYWWREAGI